MPLAACHRPSASRRDSAISRLRSEHDWWGKNRTSYYEEISHIPLMIWHPEHAARSGERRVSLTQTSDLMPTFLETHGCEVPAEVTSVSLHSLLGDDTPVSDNLILGMFGGPVCAINGKYSLFLYLENLSGENLNVYTLTFAYMTKPFDIAELQTGKLVEPFDFTKGAGDESLP